MQQTNKSDRSPSPFQNPSWALYTQSREKSLVVALWNLEIIDLLIQLQQLEEQVNDTVLSLGSDAMTNSLTVYEYVKTASKKTPGLKSVAEQLGTAFKAIKSKPAKNEPATDADLN